MKILICLLITLNLFAKTDYFLQGSLRTYPIGTALNAEIGEGYKFYDRNKILYGYVRAAANAQTSVLVNYIGAQVELYPVSFFGIYAGKSIGKRSTKKLQGFDCDEIHCDTKLNKDYYGANLALAYKGIKFINFYKKVRLDTKTDNEYFADEYSNLIGVSRDTVSSLMTILGYDLDENNMLGLLQLKSMINNLDQESTMRMFLWQHKKEDKSYQFGIGNFNNRNDKNFLGGIFLIKWDLEKGVRLF